MRYNNIMELFLSKIRRNDITGCWEWTASKNKQGYGTFYAGGDTVFAHRFSYIAFKEDIPEGLVIHHTCRVTCCVNPEHLEVTTLQKNSSLRGDNSNATHCKRGHEFTPANTYQRKDGRKQCASCKNLSYLRNKERRKLGNTWNSLVPTLSEEELRLFEEYIQQTNGE